jgi:WD40 repeat protein
MANTTIISRPNPYVGPRSFKKGEKLYGRERETSELLDLLIAERIVLLYSPSGAGKSSLLNAAITPKMEEQGFEVLPTMRVNLEPPPNAESEPGFNRYIYSLMLSIEEGQPEDKRFSVNDLASLRFVDYLKRYRERAAQIKPDYDVRGPLMLVVDQSEEVITYNPTDRDKKMDFFTQVGEVLRDRNVWALFAIREDFLAAFDPYLRPVPTRFANRYRLNLLTAEAALFSIRGPAEAQKVDFTEEAARKLTDDLRKIRVQQPDGTSVEQPGLYVEPVQLQVVCRRLWNKKVAKDTTQLTVADVAEAGSADTALADYYSLQVAIVASETKVTERSIREWFDRKLITVQGIRGQVLMAPVKSDGLDNEAIWNLEQAYLVRAEKRAGATWFELSHDRLIRPVRENNGEWFFANLSTLQRQAEVWNDQGRAEGLLLFGKDFMEAEKWAEENAADMTPVEKDFIAACKKLYSQTLRERRINTAIRWLFATSVLMALGAFYFFVRATNSEYKATARELAAAASYNVSIDPERSLLLAIVGSEFTEQPLQEVEQALHQALPAVRLKKTFSGHTDEIYRTSFSPDGALISSASYDGTVKIWDAQSGELIKDLIVIPDKAPDEFGVFDAQFNPDGRTLATVDAKGRLIIWDVKTWQKLKEIQDQTDDSGNYWASGLDYNADGSLIVVAGTDPTIHLYDGRTFDLVRTISGADDPKRHTAQIEDAVFNKQGTLIATGADDKTVRIWDVATGTFLYEFLPNIEDDEAVIFAVAFSPDGTRLVSAGADRLVYVWDIATQTQIMTIPGHLDWIFAVGYSSDGKYIISGSADRTIRFWDSMQGRPVRSLVGHTDRVFGFSLSPNGNDLASASADLTVRLWDVSKSGSSELFARDLNDRVYGVAFSPDGTKFVTGGRAVTPGVLGHKAVRIWDAATGEELAVLAGNATSITPIHWTFDSQFFLTGSDDSVYVWDAAKKAVRFVIPGDKNLHQPNGANFSPDGKLIGIAYRTGDLELFDAQTGASLRKFPSPIEDYPDYVAYDLDFSPDGKYFVYAVNTIIYTLDVATGKEYLPPLDGHTDRVEAFSFSADGNFLASVGDDGHIIVWDLRPNVTERKLVTDTGHIGSIFNVKFEPNGKGIVTTGADARVIVWDFDAEQAKLTPHVQLYGHTDRIWGLDISPDGNHVLTGTNDGIVRMFTVDAAELVRTAKAHLTRSFTDQECQDYFRVTCADMERFHQSFLYQLVVFFRDTLGIIQ